MERLNTFTAREDGQMLMVYGEARGNAALALRIYVERYPDARHPADSRVIMRAYQRVLNNQPVVPVQEGAGRPTRGQDEDRILDIIRRNPRLGFIFYTYLVTNEQTSLQMERDNCHL